MSPHGKECLEYEQNERANPEGNCEKLLQCKDCKNGINRNPAHCGYVGQQCHRYEVGEEPHWSACLNLLRYAESRADTCEYSHDKSTGKATDSYGR